MKQIPAALAFALLLSSAHAADALRAPLDDAANGPAVAVLAELPTGPGPHPALVLAPGAGFHMRMPLMDLVSRELAARGVAVYRFDWRYQSATPRGKPSADLVEELRDLRAVIALARGDARIDAKRLMVGGKSMGSVVAWRALAADPGLMAGVLLTPLCSRVPDGASAPRDDGPTNYPGLATEGRPLLLLSGDRDPLCHIPLLYRLAATAPASTRVVVVGGDHGFASPRRADADAALARSNDAVARAVADFIADSDAAPAR